jgi:hypothetical protein
MYTRVAAAIDMINQMGTAARRRSHAMLVHNLPPARLREVFRMETGSPPQKYWRFA